jgi:hypothetical protein
MRDKSHTEQVKRWANYVKKNPDWKKKLKPFLDAQIIIARRFYNNLKKTPGGKEKIKMLKKIRKIRLFPLYFSFFLLYFFLKI